MFTQRLVIGLLLAGCTLFVACRPSKKASNSNGVEEMIAAEIASIDRVTQSENQLDVLAPSMSILGKFIKDPNTDASSIFLPQIKYRSVAGEVMTAKINQFSVSGTDASQPLTEHAQLPVSQAETSLEPAGIWAAIRGPFKFEDAQFGTLAASFVDTNTFEMDTKFEGRFRGQDGRIFGVKALQTIRWIKDSEQWRISQWLQTRFDLKAAPTPLFSDVTEQAIPIEATRKQLQRSIHQEKLIEAANKPADNLAYLSEEFKDNDDWESSYQYPSASVIDLDQDGFDDLFVMDRWGPAQLLRNQGDGTFEDVTATSGLAVEDLANCALFADFDNDGDSDVFVGRTLKPSQFFENVDGVFMRDESQSEAFKYVKYVVSGAIVDINGDGLLDLYLNTYGFPRNELIWTDDTFRPQDRAKMKDRVKNAHWFLDRGGSTNIVLMNDHGRLKRVEVDDTLGQWRNSYQTVWSDFDLDGDQDMYICNDFSPDYFLRNDTQRGSFELKFADVSKEMVPGDTMGFGMGASWGDYNNDGRLDLYVSNMYSKAGNRIVAQLDGIDEQIKVSARGNFLYENQGKEFRQVAGLDDDDQQISVVGWSFGGQFADFDNDGDLDLYVPSGYYTPPVQVQRPGDL